MIDQKCEVHAFDPNMYEEEEGERENGVKFHKVGIGSRSADGVLQEIALSLFRDLVNILWTTFHSEAGMDALKSAEFWDQNSK